MLALYNERIEAQDSGAPIVLQYDEDDIPKAYIKVKRIGTPAYNEEIEELRLIKYSHFDPRTTKQETEILIEWLVSSGVTGWFGINDAETNEPLPFSRENCRRIFMSKSYLGLVNEVLSGASIKEAYLESTIKELEKDLGKPLAEM
jgi:hypothetical protein